MGIGRAWRQPQSTGENERQRGPPADAKRPSPARRIRPPGELDRLRMNQPELSQAAESTQGRFYTILDANELLDDLPSGVGVIGGGGPGGGGARIPPAATSRVSLGSPMPAIKLWNTWWIFALVMFLLTSEWVLRKRKHLL